jgi:hypothetical protein
MFLRCSTRKKDGKEHHYWSLVENRRLAEGRVVQRHVLNLGEINDEQSRDQLLIKLGQAKEEAGRLVWKFVKINVAQADNSPSQLLSYHLDKKALTDRTAPGRLLSAALQSDRNRSGSTLGALYPVDPN